MTFQEDMLFKVKLMAHKEKSYLPSLSEAISFCRGILLLNALDCELVFDLACVCLCVHVCVCVLMMQQWTTLWPNRAVDECRA